MKADLVIKHVEIIDGTGSKPHLGSVAVKNGKICADGERWECENVIDGTGLTLTPGFIDVHSHGDFVAGHDYANFSGNYDRNCRSVRKQLFSGDTGIQRSSVCKCQYYGSGCCKKIAYIHQSFRI